MARMLSFTAGIDGKHMFQSALFALRKISSLGLKGKKGVDLVGRLPLGILPIPAVSVSLKHFIDSSFYHVVSNLNRTPGQRCHRK